MMYGDDDNNCVEGGGGWKSLEEGFQFSRRVPTCLRSRFSKRPIVYDTSGNPQVIMTGTF